MTPLTEEEIKRTIHVRLQAIVDRAKSEYFDARLEYARAKAAVEEARRLEAEDFGGGFGRNGRLDSEESRTRQKEERAQDTIRFWEVVRDWADEKLIGPLAEEAKRN